MLDGSSGHIACPAKQTPQAPLRNWSEELCATVHSGIAAVKSKFLNLLNWERVLAHPLKTESPSLRLFFEKWPLTRITGGAPLLANKISRDSCCNSAP